MRRISLAAAALTCLVLAGCKPAGKGASSSGAARGRSRGAAQGGPAISAPRTWLEAHKALTLLGRHSEVEYVVTVPRLEGLVGPFKAGERLTATELLAAVARATGTELSRVGGIAVLQPPASRGKRSCSEKSARHAAFALAESFRVEAIAPLVAMLGSKDAAARRAAVLALNSFEGDFARNEWPGRVSVFELEGLKLNVDTLMWMVEESAARGGPQWRAAVSVLARSGESQLGRSIWFNSWSRTPGTIMPTIWAMGRCGDPAMRAALDKRIRRTFTSSHTDRFVTAEAVARLGLVGTLKKHADKKYPELVRAAAAWGLGRCGESKVAFEVLEALLKDRSPLVREVTVLALIEANSAESIGRLSDLLLDTRASIRLRCAAAGVLGRFSVDELGETEIEELVTVVAGDKDPRLRAAVAEALGEAGGPSAARLLEKMFDDRDRWVRAAAWRARLAIGTETAAGPKSQTVADGLGKVEDVEVRIAAVVGMGQSHDPAYAPVLGAVALSTERDWRLRKYAARSLAMLAGRAGQPALRKLLEMKSGGISDIPLRYLDLGDDARTTAYLTPWVTRGRGTDQQSCAVERIGELGTPRGVALLAAGFNAFSNYTRCTNEYSLQNNGAARVRRELVKLLATSRRSGVRVNSALGLSGAGDPRAVDALVKALADENAEVRMAAANSLGNCGDPAAATALVKTMLEDKNLRVSHQALRALRMHGYAHLAKVKSAFETVRGTDRDAGVPGGASIWKQGDNSWVLRKYYRGYDDMRLPNLTYESTVIYDPATRKMVQWGAHGRRADSPQTGLTWVLDPKAQFWSRPKSREEPVGRCCNRDMAGDHARSLAVLPQTGSGGHGWVMHLRKHAARSVPWVFDIRNGQWYPMRPTYDPGGHGFSATCYDRRNDAVIVHGGRERIYDAHRNAWTSLRPPEPRPHEKGHQPGAYDPVTGRFVITADRDNRGRARTWAYDLAANRWTDLKAKNPPPAMRVPMVYDSANDVMLAFRPVEGRMMVHVYHPRENRWDEAPATYPAPSYRMTDASYDPVHNVTWMIGGWEWGQSGAVTTRETWTYRYRQVAKPRLSQEPRSLRLTVSIKEDAPPQLTWRAPAAGAPPGGYYVYRGEGENTWTARWKRLTKAPIKDAGLSLADEDLAKPGFYRVTAVGADGKESVPSLLVRTRPAPVRRVFAARRADGSVKLEWEPSPGPATAGYNVYRAPAAMANLWRKSVKLRELTKQFVKITKQPVKGAGLVDTPGKPAPPACESTWSPFFVYIVRAVNSHGLEGGPSPATVSIPAAPGPVLVARLGDGRRLVLSGQGGSEVRGHHLYRMDVYKGNLIFRSRGAPQPGTVFIDDQSWPIGHRRQYFVIGVDGAGQLGVPSSPGWEEIP